MSELEQIGQWIGRQIFTAPQLEPHGRDLRPGALPVLRYSAEEGMIARCQPEDEGAFACDGRGLHVALLGTGLPAVAPQPFARMDVHPVDGAERTDPTAHDHLNYVLLSQWLPAAHFHVFVLKTFAREDGGLGVSDRHIDAALEACKRLEQLDFIISSITPSHHRFLSNIHLFTRQAQEEPIISFWPTGNWIPGTPGNRRSSIGSVNRNVIVAGQVQQVRIWRWATGLFRVPRNARYDEEQGLPHYWAPGFGGVPEAAGSSYSTVPVALVWIKMAQMVKLFQRHRLIDAIDGDLTDFIRFHLKNGKVRRGRIISWRRPNFPKGTKGLINLPTALVQGLEEQAEEGKAAALIAALYEQTGFRVLSPRARWTLACLALIGGLCGGVMGHSLHVELWAHYAPLLDLFYFDGWAYTVGITEPGWVVAQVPWSAGAWALVGMLLVWVVVYGCARLLGRR
jgi:hypothetical protein